MRWGGRADVLGSDSQGEFCCFLDFPLCKLGVAQGNCRLSLMQKECFRGQDTSKVCLPSVLTPLKDPEVKLLLSLVPWEQLCWPCSGVVLVRMHFTREQDFLAASYKAFQKSCSFQVPVDVVQHQLAPGRGAGCKQSCCTL